MISVVVGSEPHQPTAKVNKGNRTIEMVVRFFSLWVLKRRNHLNVRSFETCLFADRRAQENVWSGHCTPN